MPEQTTPAPDAPTPAEGWRRWRRLDRGTRRRLARRRGDPPRDREEAHALLGFTAHLRGWTGIVEWAVVGMVGALIGLLLAGTVGGADPTVTTWVVFVAGWTMGGAIVRPLQGRRLRDRTDARPTDPATG